MNNADKHLAHWSNTDVQRYLNGELSAGEMHDLEQQALDDPFLADALEGLQTQSGETLQQDLSELRARLDTRVTEKRRTIPWRTMRAAAAVIFLIGLGLTAYYTLLNRSSRLAKPSVVASRPTAVSPVPPAADSARTPAPMADDNAPSLAQSSHRERIAAKRPARRPASAEPALQSVESPVESDSSTYTADVLKKTPPVESGLAATQRPQPAPPATVVPNFVAVSGQVLDLNHHPLAGAYLMYKSQSGGKITGAVTDDKGQFSLYVPQKDSTRQLTVAMEGYEETQYALNTNEQRGNTIYLRQNPARLDEVVVSGIGAKRKEFMAQPPSDEPEKLDSFWLNTAPVMGRISYLNYLASAPKNLPVDTTIHGTESISFRVDKKGALTEFRIERSLSPAHDAGVIRLITEGPPWRMIRGRTARALVNVSF